MSVSFTAEMSEIIGYSFTCGHDNGRTEHRFGAYKDAESFLVAELAANGGTGHLAICGDEDCQYQRMHIEVLESDPSPVVNVTKTNAVLLLGLLGLDSEDNGPLEPGNFMGRVLMAQAVNPSDAGVPATESTEGGVLLINCGRREGYAEDRLADLHELAEFAVRTGRDIYWA